MDLVPQDSDTGTGISTATYSFLWPFSSAPLHVSPTPTGDELASSSNLSSSTPKRPSSSTPEPPTLSSQEPPSSSISLGEPSSSLSQTRSSRPCRANASRRAPKPTSAAGGKASSRVAKKSSSRRVTRAIWGDPSTVSEDEFKIRGIVDERIRKGKTYYCIQWDGTDEKGNLWPDSWELAEHANDLAISGWELTKRKAMEAAEQEKREKSLAKESLLSRTAKEKRARYVGSDGVRVKLAGNR